MLKTDGGDDIDRRLGAGTRIYEIHKYNPMN